MGRKGLSSGATEIYAPTSENKFVLNTRLSSAFDRGTITSTRIGPSMNWKELFWGWNTIDPVREEKVNLSVYAIGRTNGDSLILDNFSGGTYDLSALDANRFPYLRVQANLLDTLFRRPRPFQCYVQY